MENDDNQSFFPPPKKPKNVSTLVLGIVLIFIILGAIGYYIYRLSQPNPVSSPSPSPSPKTSKLTSPSPTISPTLSPTISPTKSGDNFQIPTGEIYLISSKADTNGDGKEEILVITQKTNNKFHAYVLSSDGKNLFDNPDLGQKPLRIATQIYATGEKYPSWMLVFTEESGNLAFIHWNGTRYEIPKENLGI